MSGVRYLLLGALAWAILLGGAIASPRPATVADIVSITLPRELGVHREAELRESPDGGHFTVLVNRGDVAAGVRRFEIWLFDASLCRKGPCQPKVIASATTSDNFPALGQVQWISDESLAYLGRDDSGRSQVFRYELAEGRARPLTESDPGVRAFDFADDGRAMVYMERGPGRHLFPTQADRYRGVEAADLPFASLMTESAEAYPNNLRLEEPGGIIFVRDGRRLRASIPSTASCPPEIGFDLSPDGRRVLMHCYVSVLSLPDGRAWLDGDHGFTWSETIVPWVLEEGGGDHRLIDTPLPPSGGTIAQHWVGGGGSVILHTLAPLEEQTGPLRSEVVEVDVETGARRVIATGPMIITSWEPAASRLILTPRATRAGQPAAGGVAYVRGVGGWRKAGAARVTPRAGPRIVEDYRTPPTLIMADGAGRTIRTVADFNPQLKDLALGEVRNLSITVPGEQAPIHYGLYLPVGFEPGKRYPVVLQTHGWHPASFQMEGYGSAGYAAQVLAGKGFVVVQTEDSAVLTRTNEGDANVAVYETVLGELDRQGMIDTDRMGIQGWSRTGVSARWMLLHSKYRFRAALLVDSMALSYMEYLTAEQPSSGFQDTVEGIVGAAPIGREGLRTWARTSPAFNYEDIDTPVKLFAFKPAVLAASWEDYVVLKRLGKAVELTYLPDADHMPLRPAERMTVQDGAVDWWAYWLKGERDAAAAKVDQYERWDALASRSPGPL